VVGPPDQEQRGTVQPIAWKADRARKLVGKGAPVSTVGRDMTRFYDIAGWLCSSLGVALLVTSLVLVPENRVLGNRNTGGCAGDECNIVCTAQAAPCSGTQPPCNNHGNGAGNAINVAVWSPLMTETVTADW